MYSNDMLVKKLSEKTYNIKIGPSGYSEVPYLKNAYGRQDLPFNVRTMYAEDQFELTSANLAKVSQILTLASNGTKVIVPIIEFGTYKGEDVYKKTSADTWSYSKYQQD